MGPAGHWPAGRARRRYNHFASDFFADSCASAKAVDMLHAPSHMVCLGSADTRLAFATAAPTALTSEAPDEEYVLQDKAPAVLTVREAATCLLRQFAGRIAATHTPGARSVAVIAFILTIHPALHGRAGDLLAASAGYGVSTPGQAAGTYLPTATAVVGDGPVASQLALHRAGPPAPFLRPQL